MQQLTRQASRLPAKTHSTIVLADLDGIRTMNARVPFGAGLFFAPTGKRHHVAVQVPLIRDGQARQYLAMGVGAGNRQPLLMNSQLPAGWVGVRTAGYFTRSGTSGRTVVLNVPLDERRRPAVNAAIFLAAIDAARREQPAVP